MPGCWVNGRAVDPRTPALTVFERGFLFADGVFETIRASRGIMIQLDAHIDRLFVGLERLRIPVPPHLDETLSDAERALRASGEDASVRLVVARGAAPGLLPTAVTDSTCVLIIHPLPPIPNEVYSRGLSTIVAAGRRNDRSATAGLKTLAFTDHIAALLEARERGADDAILLDAPGHVVEGSTSNIFVVIRDEIYTPPLSCGILPGITRAAVMTIVSRWNGAVQDRILVPSDLTAADEIFLTSSLRGIAPVASVDGTPVGSGGPGTVTQRIMAEYEQMVADEIVDVLADDPTAAPTA